MKKISILNNKTNQSFGTTSEDPTEWINFCIANNSWGKPIRWVRAKLEKEFAYYGDGSPNDGFWFPDEQYDDADVVDTRQEEENGEFVQYVQLKAEYTIEITDYVPPVPQSISPAQARLALVHAGLYQSVQDTVAVATDEVKIYWDYATVFERNNPILTSMASAIGIDSDQLDDLFRLGVTL